MKTARLQVLTTPAFRDWLRKEAKRAGVSVAELVRTRCEGSARRQRPSAEEKALAEMAVQLRQEAKRAQSSLRSRLAEADLLLQELRAQREHRQKNRDERAVANL